LIVKLDRFCKYFSPWAVLVEAIFTHPFGAGVGGAGIGVVVGGEQGFGAASGGPGEPVQFKKPTGAGWLAGGGPGLRNRGQLAGWLRG
jgi:hypothetical protein